MYSWLRGRSPSEKFADAASSALGVSVDEFHVACEVGARCPGDRQSKSGTYGNLVREAAKSKGLTLGRVAALSGVGRSTLFDALSGDRTPRDSHVVRVADVLELDPVRLSFAAGKELSASVEEIRARCGRDGPVTVLAARKRNRRRVSKIGERVLRHCDRRGMTVAAFASEIGASRGTVERWISGGGSPIGERKLRVAYHLGVPAGQLAA